MKERRAEVEAYLNYLDHFQSSLLTDADAECFFKVAKANVFVMLYNLVEATTKACFDDVSSDLSNKSVRHSQLNTTVRHEWVRHYFKSNALVERHEEEQRVCISALVEEVLRDELVGELLPDQVVSGNVDEKELYKLARRFGIIFSGGADGTALQTIKSRRNWLAHGNEKFSDLGKDFAVGDLRNYSTNCLSFMQRFVESTDDYVSNDRFR